MCDGTRLEAGRYLKQERLLSQFNRVKLSALEDKIHGTDCAEDYPLYPRMRALSGKIKYSQLNSMLVLLQWTVETNRRAQLTKLAKLAPPTL